MVADWYIIQKSLNNQPCSENCKAFPKYKLIGGDGMSNFNIKNLVRTPEGIGFVGDDYLSKSSFKNTNNLSYAGGIVGKSNIGSLSLYLLNTKNDKVFADSLPINSDKKLTPNIELYSTVRNLIKLKDSPSDNVRYILQLVHKKRTITGKEKDYSYEIFDNDTGSVLTLLKENLEAFFKNPDWDGTTESKRLLSGRNSFVKGISEYYYSRSNNWYARIDPDIPSVLDEDITKVDSYLDYLYNTSFTVKEVYAKSEIVHGLKTEKIYKYIIEEDSSHEKESYTSQELLNLIDTGSIGEYKYDTARLHNAVVEYVDGKYQVSVDKTNVVWHIDEIPEVDTTALYVCLKAYSISVHTSRAKTDKLVEFEVISLNEEDVENLKSGSLSQKELFTFDKKLIALDDLQLKLEVPLAKKAPFFFENKIDNLKLINRRDCDIYTKYADFNLYTPEELNQHSISHIAPKVETLDYDSWNVTHSELTDKIREAIVKEEGEQVVQEIDWNDVVAFHLDSSDITAKGIELQEFILHSNSKPVRISTLLPDNTYPLYYDILNVGNNTYLVKEKFVESGLRTGLVRKFHLTGNINKDINKENAVNYIKLYALMAEKIGRGLVLILGTTNDRKFIIACRRDFSLQDIFDDTLKYIPVTYSAKVKAQIISDSLASAATVVKEQVGIIETLPKDIDIENLSIDEKQYKHLEETKGFGEVPTLEKTNTVPTIACKSSVLNNTTIKVEKIIRAKDNVYDATVTFDNKGYVTIRSEDDINSVVRDKSKWKKAVGVILPDTIAIEHIDLLKGEEEGTETRESLSSSDKEGATLFWEGLDGAVIMMDSSVSEHFSKLKDTALAINTDSIMEGENSTENIVEVPERTSEIQQEVKDTQEVKDIGPADEEENVATKDIEVFSNKSMRFAFDANADRIIGSTSYSARTLYNLDTTANRYESIRKILKKGNKNFVSLLFKNIPDKLQLEHGALVYAMEYQDELTLRITNKIINESNIKNIKIELSNAKGIKISKGAALFRKAIEDYLCVLGLFDAENKEKDNIFVTKIELLDESPEIESLYNKMLSTENSCKLTYKELCNYFINVSNIEDLGKLFKFSSFKYNEEISFVEEKFKATIDGCHFECSLVPVSIIIMSENADDATKFKAAHTFVDSLYKIIEDAIIKLKNDSISEISASTFKFSGKASLRLNAEALILSDDTSYNPISVKKYADTVFKLCGHPVVKSYEDLTTREDIWSKGALYQLYHNLNQDVIGNMDAIYSEYAETKELKTQKVINGKNVTYKVNVSKDSIVCIIEVESLRLLSSKSFIESWISWDIGIGTLFNKLIADGDDAVNWDNLINEEENTTVIPEDKNSDIEDWMSLLDSLEESGATIVDSDIDFSKLPVIEEEDDIPNNVEISGEDALELLHAIILNLDDEYDEGDEDRRIGADSSFELSYATESKQYTSTEQVTNHLLKEIEEKGGSWPLGAEIKDYIIALRANGTVLGIIESLTLIHNLKRMLYKYGKDDFFNHVYEEDMVKVTADEFLKDLYKAQTGINLNSLQVDV